MICSVPGVAMAKI